MSNLPTTDTLDTNDDPLQPAVVKQLNEGAVAMAPDGSLAKVDEDVLSLEQQGGQELDTSSPEATKVQPPPSSAATENDEDAIGRAQLIASMKLDEGKEGGDDPFTQEEKTMLDDGVATIKAALADTKKTKVRTSAEETRDEAR